MNEINIYAKYDYRILIKKANLFFIKKYKWYNPKSVIAPYDGTYSISIFKHNIHISYWDEQSSVGQQNKFILIKFLEENIKGMDISIDYVCQCDLVTILKQNNTLLQGRMIK